MNKPGTADVNGYQCPRIALLSEDSDFILKSSPKTYLNYKSKPPEETLQWIQELLRPFFPPHIHAGINSNEFGSTWYCRVALLNPYIGQNGKGATIPLALASGFAEFMERFQALYTLRYFSTNLPHLMRVPEAILDNEGAYWKKFSAALHEEMNDLIPQSVVSRSLESAYYRFFDILNENSLIYLDESLAYTPFSTTGTAAGNTREEAIVQALCELFERYAVRKIIESHTVVPSIPWSYLSEQTQIMLYEIQNAGFDVYVRDFSMGIGLPVACVVIGTPELGYHARPGCATDINVAVERCVLEFYQGFTSTKDRIIAGRDITDKWKELYAILSDYLSAYITSDEFIVENYFTGYDFPPDELAFLTEDSSEPFKPYDYSRTDFFEEIQLLLDLCRKNQFRVYVRDIGWMGFPVVQILSPELKNLEFNSFRRRVVMSEELKKFHHLLHQGVDGIRTHQFLDLLRTPEILYFCMQLGQPRVDWLCGLVQERHLANLNHWYFLGFVAYYFRDIALARCFFRCYGTFQPQEDYSRCLVRLFEILPEYPWDENDVIREDILSTIRKELCRTFSSAVVEEVLSDFRIPAAVLDDAHEVLFPCEECEACSIVKECSYGQLIPIMKRLQEAFPNALQWKEKWIL